MSQHHRNGGWTSKDSAHWRPIIEASLPAPCVDCGRPIHRGDKWQVGHRVSKAEAAAMGWTKAQSNRAENLGPSHTKAPGQRACNQIAGGKLGARITNTKRRTERADERQEPGW
jgi:hypothetical protein